MGRTTLREIAPEAWEHPADRAALRALRAVPGFDEILRRVVGLLGERGVRLLFQADAVRVGPTQFSRVDALYDEVLATLDCSARMPLFVSQSPVVNAGAYGLEQPFIVLNSGAIALLDDAELAFVIAHEVGHVLSGHALYHTMLRLLLWVGRSAAPVAIGMVRLPLQIALLEWYRNSELSCDRAGLLGMQQPQVALRALLKLAGGGKQHALDVDAFLAQGREYDEVGSIVDRVFKLLNTLGRTHPFWARRAVELQRWSEHGEYPAILSGQYPRQSEVERPDYGFSAAASHYADDLRTVGNEVANGARQVVDAARDAVQAWSAAIRKGRE